MNSKPVELQSLFKQFTELLPLMNECVYVAPCFYGSFTDDA